MGKKILVLIMIDKYIYFCSKVDPFGTGANEICLVGFFSLAI